MMLFTCRCSIAILALVSLVGCSQHRLKPFLSDGCSAFPDGTLDMTLSVKTSWHSCCVAHDRAYWLGGSKQDRLNADKTLKACVEQVANPKIAAIMLAGVRVGGSPMLPTSFRWGYGWSYPRFYGELTAAETKMLEVAKKLIPTTGP